MKQIRDIVTVQSQRILEELTLYNENAQKVGLTEEMKKCCGKTFVIRSIGYHENVPIYSLSIIPNTDTEKFLWVEEWDWVEEMFSPSVDQTLDKVVQEMKLEIYGEEFFLYHTYGVQFA